MAEQTAEQTAERRATRSRQRAERNRAAMANPKIPDEPSDLRHAAYFIGVLAFALVLNLVVLVIGSGGQ